MAKETAKTKACATKTMYAIMQELKHRGGVMKASEVFSYLEQNVQFTEWEKERAGKMQWVRWRANTQFYSINYVKAGYIVKRNGSWYLTPEGEKALSMTAEQLMEVTRRAYLRWRAENMPENESDEPDETDIEKSMPAINVENLEAEALVSIKNYIAAKGPYEFQDIVAALLRAMGYYTPFIAPKGKDGGIDIIAYLDPLGARTPRIKVQVKHRPETSIGSPEIRSLLGVLRTGDIALFITSGTFSPDARNTATNAKEFIRIIDGDEFIQLWQDYYDKMPDEDKNMLPLKRIAFLGSNE